MKIQEPTELVGIVKTCPHPDCGSTDIRWRYYNNIRKARFTQPRYGCNACDRQFTYGGSIRLASRKKGVTKMITRRTAKAAKAARKAARADKKAATQTAKRAAKASKMTGLESLDQLTHPTLFALRGEVEIISELASDRCEFQSRVDGVDVMEHVEEGADDEHVGLELEALVNGPPDIEPGFAYSETRMDGVGLDSGLSLLEMWDLCRGEIEFGLPWMSDSCGDGSVFGDSRHAWVLDSCGDGSAEDDSGLAWVSHSCSSGNADCDSGLAWVSSSCGDGSAADSGGSGGWVDSGSAGSESEMEWADSLIAN